MTWRTTVRTNTHQQLVDYQAANPTELAQVFKARPGGPSAAPFAYVGEIRLAFSHPGSTLRVQNTGEVDVIFLTDVVDNGESKAELDTVVDGFTDQVSALPHYLGNNTSWETISSEDTAESYGGLEYTGVVVTIGGITGQQGGF